MMRTGASTSICMDKIWWPNWEKCGESLLFHLLIGLALWARQNRLQEKKANRVRRCPLQSSENHFREGETEVEWWAKGAPLTSGSSIGTFFSPLSHLTTTSFLFNPLPVFPRARALCWQVSLIGRAMLEITCRVSHPLHKCSTNEYISNAWRLEGYPTTQPKLASNSRSSCICLPNAGVTGLQAFLC